jgi:NADH:ubiquinone oxidoreductase subunit F (NADH-binding)
VVLSIVDVLDEAGLTGRGGAAFQTAVKLRAAFANRAQLIVNVCDGEIGAQKDAHVVQHHRDELIRGAQLISRRDVRYAAHRGSATLRRLRQANLDVIDVPQRYVSSEESSLLSLANGGLARPITKRTPIAFGTSLPDGTAFPATLVLNAETVWRIAQITEYGPRWFRSFGTQAEPGPRLVSVCGAVADPCVVEAEAGHSIPEIVAAGGGPTGSVRAVGISGLSGGWLTGAEATSAEWSNAGLAPFGLRTGAGIVHVIDTSTCPLATIREWLIYARGESAGQCGPCMFGVPAVIGDMIAMIDGRQPDRLGMMRFEMRVDQLRDRGACRFPDGIGAFVTSVLRTFPKLIEAHAGAVCPSCIDARSRRRLNRGRLHADALA